MLQHLTDLTVAASGDGAAVVKIPLSLFETLTRL